MLGIGLGLCYLFVRSYVRSENRETPLYRGFFRETVRSLEKSQNLSPHPSFAHPSPKMGGEFGGTPTYPPRSIDRSLGSPPQLRAFLALLSRLPTPLRGGVLARGAGCKITAIKQVVPNVGTLYSHVGNI